MLGLVVKLCLGWWIAFDGKRYKDGGENVREESIKKHRKHKNEAASTFKQIDGHLILLLHTRIEVILFGFSELLQKRMHIRIKIGSIELSVKYKEHGQQRSVYKGKQQSILKCTRSGNVPIFLPIAVTGNREIEEGNWDDPNEVTQAISRGKL